MGGSHGGEENRNTQQEEAHDDETLQPAVPGRRETTGWRKKWQKLGTFGDRGKTLEDARRQREGEQTPTSGSAIGPDDARIPVT